MKEADIPLRKPRWIRVSLEEGEGFRQVAAAVRAEGLHTVCEEARCPNVHECWGREGTASFMILGDTCTRRCRFCAVETGLPASFDPLEPLKVATAVERMGLRHAHITMVARDDLPDGGAGQLAATVRAIHRRVPGCTVEVLSSDLMGSREAIALLAASAPEILSHNLETVRRLSPLVRSRSDHDRSLAFLRAAKELAPRSLCKTSLMLGLGEERGELLETFEELRAAGVELLSLGQYLQPSRNQLPVRRYLDPEEFEELRAEALSRGFLHCEAGPLVRSSYHAASQLELLRGPRAGEGGPGR